MSPNKGNGLILNEYAGQTYKPESGPKKKEPINQAVYDMINKINTVKEDWSQYQGGVTLVAGNAANTVTFSGDYLTKTLANYTQ